MVYLYTVYNVGVQRPESMLGGGAHIEVWTEPRKLKKRKLGVLYVEQQPKVLII